MLKFYHYMPLLDYHSMQFWHGFKPGSEKSHLQTGCAMVAPCDEFQREPHLSYNNAIFGVLEPEPESWWREWHPSGSTVMEAVLSRHDKGHHVYRDQILQLEVSVHEDDPVFVADWGVHLAENAFPDQVYSRFSKEVKRNYAQSLVSLKEYRSEMGYRLPEVVCFKDIPFEQTRIFSRDMASFLCARMREKYGHAPDPWARDKNIPDYACPVVFD